MISSMCFLLIAHISVAQDELMNMLEEDQEPYPVSATFKSTRIINGHSVKTDKKGVLQFIIGHRFGTVNSGIENLFGLDDSWIRLGLDYGITDDLNIGVGRSSFLKTYDGFVKYRLIRQMSKGGGSPVTVTAFANTSIDTQDPPGGLDYEFRHQMAYSTELLIARKFSSNFSMQLMPVWVHRNLVPAASDQNDRFAIGVAGRHKITGSTALTFEYYYDVESQTNDDQYNSIGIGVDIETGGHVFQLHFTNSRGMVEKDFLTNNTGDFFDGNIHIGFNIVRVFQIVKDKEIE